jgi:DNA-binding cell septation regulator SpoVG
MIRCTKFTPLEKGALRGFADFALDSGMVLHDCMLMESNGRRWLGLPSKQRLDRDKNPMKDENGKLLYSPIVSVPDRDRRDAFNDAALAAIDAFTGAQS